MPAVREPQTRRGGLVSGLTRIGSGPFWGDGSDAVNLVRNLHFSWYVLATMPTIDKNLYPEEPFGVLSKIDLCSVEKLE